MDLGSAQPLRAGLTLEDNLRKGGVAAMGDAKAGAAHAEALRVRERGAAQCESWAGLSGSQLA